VCELSARRSVAPADERLAEPLIGRSSRIFIEQRGKGMPPLGGS
jgi:hypothetical protein